MTIQAILANYLNGNLTDAKQGAKRHSWRKLYLALRDDCQVDEHQARRVADYLKGKGPR